MSVRIASRALYQSRPRLSSSQQWQSLRYQSTRAGRTPLRSFLLLTGSLALTGAAILMIPRPKILLEAAPINAVTPPTGIDQPRQSADSVPTGTTTVPYFPRTIHLPHTPASNSSGLSTSLPAGLDKVTASAEEEYQLLGLGLRTVSIFGIEVYVVGVYVATKDMNKLQSTLVRAVVGEGATTLVQGEKDDLRARLLDGAQSETIWSDILQSSGIQSAIRIVPVKDTNFSHLRDGWVRGLDARAKKDPAAFKDEAYVRAADEFKAMMGGRSTVAKGRVLILSRDHEGRLRSWVDVDAEKKVQGPEQVLLTGTKDLRQLGEVSDERISRSVWMGYLSGAKVSSEIARKSVVAGLMDLVARPVGTVETRVV